MTLAVLLLAFTGLLRADLAEARAEENLEKRSELAMKNAGDALDRARDAYRKADETGVKAALAEYEESIELCRQSLEDSGRNARKKPKYFKKAEIGARQLSRRLDTLRSEMSVDDRPAIDPMIEKTHQFQESILAAIMGKKK
jgi:hypothetical protein